MAGSRPDPSLPEGADRIPAIKHIVVLMLENHSYDNYFGMLSDHGDGLPLGPDGQPTIVNHTSDGVPVPLRPSKGRPTATTQVPGVPTQSWNASHIQWDQGACDGFVRSVQETLPGKDPTVPMTYWAEPNLPFYYGLARTFPLATRWFCSCLGPTFPNRRFLIAGTAHGLIDDLPFGMVDYPESGTILDLLSANGISWANYHNASPLTLNLRRLAGTRGHDLLQLVPAVLAGLLPSVEGYAKGKLQTTSATYPLGLLSSLNHLRTMRRFFADARAGTLPGFSIVDPDFGESSEENPQDIQRGEAFSARVIHAVMEGKGWPNTLLVWLYDEHGGYFDHVNPPAAVAPDGVRAGDPIVRSWVTRHLIGLTPYAKLMGDINAGPSTYTNYGFRVPAVIVSPYARPGWVSETVYDHTSILKLVEEKWNLPALTQRDLNAVSPLDTLDFSGPPAFGHPPARRAPAMSTGI
jgi:phospholipase C